METLLLMIGFAWLIQQTRPQEDAERRNGQTDPEPGQTVLGQEGQGIRIQETNQNLMLSLSGHEHLDGYRFKFRFINTSQSAISIPMLDFGLRFEQQVHLAIVDWNTIRRFGNTPKWFMDTLASIPPDAETQMLIHFINGVMARTPTELTTGLLENLQVVRHIKPRDRNAVGTYQQVILPGEALSKDIIIDWNLRNDLGERIASGIYFAIAWVEDAARNHLASGWYKFQLIK